MSIFPYGRETVTPKPVIDIHTSIGSFKPIEIGLFQLYRQYFKSLDVKSYFSVGDGKLGELIFHHIAKISLGC